LLLIDANCFLLLLLLRVAAAVAAAADVAFGMDQQPPACHKTNLGQTNFFEQRLWF